MRINIAIDGPSAAGKSTIAKLLASHLGYSYLDTGAMYRCVGYLSKQIGIDENDEDALTEMIHGMKISFDHQQNVYINDENVTLNIRTNEMSMRASNVSKHKNVRAALVALQQEIAKEQGYILDGRDIGTVVLPNAQLKIFMVASCEARALRRMKENQQKGIEADYQVILEDIQKRDYQDSHRSNSPLKKADDAIEIDTSDMSIDEVVNMILELVKAKGVKV